MPIESPSRKALDVRNVLAASAAVLLLAAPARAQQSVGDALAFLITTQAVDTGDASRDRAAARATSDTLARSIVAALATLPLTSSSSGFAYRFNPTLGTVERSSGSFGPLFVERAITGGAGQLSVAVTWQFASFTQLDGMPLKDGTLVTTSNRFVDESQPFDVETLQLNVRANTLTFSAAYGLTSWLDIGAAVPLTALSLDGLRVDTYRGTRYQQASASASVARLGDVLVREKAAAAHWSWGAVAAGADIRLPTGASADLLGAGQTGTREFGVLSVGSSAVSAHLNGGLNQGGVSSGPDLSGALTVAATPQFTLTGELLWRHFDDIGRITASTSPHPTLVGVETLRLLPVGDTSTLAGSLGLKWNLGGPWLLRANVYIPLNDNGLTARAIPSLALEYHAGR
jgi:hypothetical protein